jgi:[protein-PII] uridylyltransferase
MTEALLSGPLRAACDAERTRLEQEFASRGDALATLAGRTALADRTITALDTALLAAPGARPYALVAIGGYGRQSLFPCSDVDLLLLCSTQKVLEAVRGAAATFVRHLWDLGWRASATSRTLDECDQFDAGNLEFTISLLDGRFVSGDAALFARLAREVLPSLVAREQQALLRALAEVARARHAKFGNTLFHLEPDVKDGPGGLRDFDVARWVTAIETLARHRRQKELVSSNGGWSPGLGDAAEAAFSFLAAARIFLHYRNRRDDNRLTYDLQDEAAARAIGLPGGVPGGASGGPAQPAEAQPADAWMRAYFRQARTVARLSARLLGRASSHRSGLYGAFEDWRARLSNADFSVHHGRVFCRRPGAVAEPATMLALFEFVARHGLELDEEAETAVEQALAAPPQSHDWPRGWPGEGPAAGAQFRRILALPHAGIALRAMHRTGVLDALVPEFRAVDALVVRDLYHRYTVDEHTLLTLEALHGLRRATEEPFRRFAEILAEVEQPELIYLALLLHDVGKGMAADDHVRASVGASSAACTRLGLAPYEKDLVLFLVRNHLQMSFTLQRRDIFDPETIRAFAETAATPERLKMLCLLTYADVHSVNPEALTPWKAEMLWQLYAATANYLARSVDRQRLGEASDRELLEVVRASPALAALAKPLAAFLDGFPRRYLKTHSSDEIAAHFEMARRIEEKLVRGENTAVEAQLRERRGHYEVTVVTRDRPRLFADLTGALSAWGMNILKADAFSNRAGLVLDSFTVADIYGTLTLNPEERGRLLGGIEDVVTGQHTVEPAAAGRRVRRGPAARSRSAVSTEVRCDNACSTHSTVLELVTRDQPGLLHRISELFADAGCNIEAALVDTQGERAIDVFYLTLRGKKLSDAEAGALRETLFRALRGDQPAETKPGERTT